MPAKALIKYERMFQADGSTKGFPYHVRGAMFYNSLCGPEDRAIYPDEKFYIVDVNSVETNYIAIPVVLQNPPQWVEEYPVNYDKLWGKLEKKFENYMKAMGWDSRSVSEEISKNLLGM